MRLVIDLQACQSPGGRIRGVGRYCLALAKAMASSSGEHEVWIALNGSMPESVVQLRDLLAGVVPAQRIVSWESIGPTASVLVDNKSRNLAAELVREDFLAGLGADVILTASMIDGWGDSVVTSVSSHSDALQVAILFDLIPLVMPETYLPRKDVLAWYLRKIEHLKRCDLLLGISEFTCEEAQGLLGTSAGNIENISAAVGSEFVQLKHPVSDAYLDRKYNISRGFVMYAGGFDKRKNLSSLIAAYALLPLEVRRGHQLVIVGNLESRERAEFDADRELFGVAADELVFTGFVTDVELIKLYNACTIYVFPSLREGFGLPALEAMSCGAVVIGSDTTSLPEVIGDAEALFDPYDIGSISAKILQGLTDTTFRERMRRHAAIQVRKFSWETSAVAAWAAIEAAVDASVESRAISSGLVGNRDRVALFAFGSLSGERAALIGLDGAKEVHFFNIETNDAHEAASISVSWKQKTLSEFDRGNYDCVFVQVCNKPSLARILRAVCGVSAVLLIEEESASEILAELHRSDMPLLVSILYGACGYKVLEVLGRTFDSTSALVPGFKASDLAWGFGGWTALRSLERDDSECHVDGRSVLQYRRERSLISRLAQTPGISEWNEFDISQLAIVIARNRPGREDVKTLFVDISQLAIVDAKTGIQRVVRHIVAELIASPPKGFRVEPVVLDSQHVCIYARSYCQSRFFPDLTLPADEPVAFHAGDVFLGLDLAAHMIPGMRDAFTWMRSRGVEIQFVVYDLLPLLRPDCFDEAGLPTFRRWYEAIAETADGIICISKTVANEFKLWLSQATPVRSRPLKIGHFHLGADLVPPSEASAPKEILPGELGDRATFLMVGTIEPRKGHKQAIEAFELLWHAGHDVNLVLIGKPGWRVDDLVSRLRMHPQAGKRLFWLESADDAQLVAMYHRASALLAASEGEGFGLPLIEAAQYGLPIIARDLPVFIEVAGSHSHYFSGLSADSMAGSVVDWLTLLANGAVPSSSEMPWLTWKQSARELEEVSVGGRWDESWSLGGGRHFVATDHRADIAVGELSRGGVYSRGKAGTLYATPVFEVPAGEYELLIRGQKVSNTGSAWVDVEANGREMRIASEPLVCNGSNPAALKIVLLEDLVDMRVRVIVDASAEVVLTGVDLTPLART